MVPVGWVHTRAARKGRRVGGVGGEKGGGQNLTARLAGQDFARVNVLMSKRTSFIECETST